MGLVLECGLVLLKLKVMLVWVLKIWWCLGGRNVDVGVVMSELGWFWTWN
jgi:hypothetical protein